MVKRSPWVSEKTLDPETVLSLSKNGDGIDTFHIMVSTFAQALWGPEAEGWGLTENGADRLWQSLVFS